MLLTQKGDDIIIKVRKQTLMNINPNEGIPSFLIKDPERKEFSIQLVYNTESSTFSAKIKSVLCLKDQKE